MQVVPALGCEPCSCVLTGRRAPCALGAHAFSHPPSARSGDTHLTPRAYAVRHAEIRPAWEAYWRDGQFPSSDVVILIHADAF
eukprot:4572456-Prymnesium_polylepis.2